MRRRIMRCTILHESKRRLRIHMGQCYMTIAEADILEEYMNRLHGIQSVKVYERTANIVITYDGDPLSREHILQSLSEFDYEQCEITPPEHSTRALTHEYVDKMVGQILRWVAEKLFVPDHPRRIMTLRRSLPRLIAGLRALFQRKLEVSMLDAASIAVSIVRNDFNTASSVMFLLGIGEIMEEWTHKKSVNDLAKAMSLNVGKVWVKLEDGTEVLRNASEILADDIIIIRTGNLIPLDGVVVEGDAMVNQSSITGEPLPVHKKVGGFLYAGTVVEEGEIAIAVKHVYGSGRYDRIVKMIEDSERLKSSAESRASQLADSLVPWTFGATFVTYLLTRNPTRAASILMVDFCCALKLAIPIAVLSAMREAGEHHISVKGGRFMENFAEADTIIFDKTGTLTVATPKVKDVIPFAGNDKSEMLRLAACLEEHYPHSIANAVVKEAKHQGLDHEERHSEVKYVVAHGIASSIDGKKVRIGSYHFLFEDEGCRILEKDQEKFDNLPNQYSHLYLAIEDVLCAVVLIEDPLKPEAKKVIEALREAGIDKVVMMTGDSDRTARAIAQAVGVDEYHSEVLPEEKAQFIKKEHEAGRKVIMVGDGVNDTPALSEADVGVSINSGAAIAREISDVSISENGLYSLVDMRMLSCALMKRIHSNHYHIISFNSLLIIFGMLGLFGSSTTALLHNASTIFISVNSMKNLLEATASTENKEISTKNGLNTRSPLL